MELTTNQRLALENAQQALVYLCAAERVIGEEIEGFSGDLQMMPPAGFLVAHAVELSLIAFLRFSGTKGGLSNHDLERRLSSAEAAGLEVSESFRRYVKAIAPAVKSGQFRYPREDPHAFVMPRRAIEMVRPVLEHINRSIAERAFVLNCSGPT